MAERLDVLEAIQFGLETTPGTAVAAPNRIRTAKLALNPQQEFRKHRPAGSKYDQFTVPTREWMSAGITVDNVGYNELTWLLASLIKNPTPTGSLPYTRVFSPSNTAEDTPATYTVECGQDVRSHKFAYGLLTDLAFTINRGEVSAAGTMIGQKLSDNIQMSTNEQQTITEGGSPTGGTFTLTFSGQTTAGIAYNATAAVIQAALEALSNIAPGDVVVTGGPINSALVTVEFRGAYRQANVAAMTANAAGLTPSGTITIATTVPGVAPTLIAQVPILPDKWDVYLDATGAGIGTTKIARVFNGTFSLAGVWGPFWVVDSTKASFAGAVGLGPTAHGTLRLEANAEGMAVLTAARAGTKQFIRLLATQGDAGGGTPYKLQFDFSGAVGEAFTLGEQEGISIVDWTFGMEYDDTWAKVLDVTLVNTIAALS